MSVLVGLSAYSDDEADDDLQRQPNPQPAPGTHQATRTERNERPPTVRNAVASLIGAYSDSDSGDPADDAVDGEAEASRQPSAQETRPTRDTPTHVRHTDGSTIIAASSSQSASSARLAHPLTELVAQPAAAFAPTPAAGAALDDDDRDSPIDPLLLAALPPLPPGPLSAALSARHAQNLARQQAMRGRRDMPSLVASLLRNKSFHNPCILDAVAAKLNIAQHGSNLPAAYWREQNLEEDQPEDDYIEIKRQAEEATAHRLATRTSIDFVPATVPASAASLLNTTAAAPPAARYPPDLSTQNPPRPTAGASSHLGGASRKSKWDAPSAPSAAAAASTQKATTADEENRKRQKR